ncbi:hypothetical protein RQP46_011171 [Phenoliferia psychrophenolica]
MTTAATASRPWATKAVYKTGPLPAYKDLPHKHGLRCAWDVWGAEDQIGTINLLTPEVVAKAAAAELRTGEFVSLNLPIQMPAKPCFHRKEPDVQLVALPTMEHLPVRDDVLHINSQSGSQWDGLRHFGIIEGMCFYQGVPSDSIKTGSVDTTDPLKINPEDLKLSIHHWSSTGITGRGVLLDMVRYYERDGAVLPYDPCTTHIITLKDLKACAARQGTTFQSGDVLLIRMGWTRRYLHQSSAAEKLAWGSDGYDHFAGVENSEEMREWLWQNHFSAVASDQPSFESWPAREGTVHLHSTLLGMYGMPIGEFFDLERLSELVVEKKRSTFFFTSQPLNILGGAASLANASAIF